jgi:hypothetical protein
MILIPVIAEAMPLIREMAAEIGEKLKAALESVDWASTIKAIVDFIAFLVTNAEAIVKLVAGLFILNTAFKLMAVASGIATVALNVKKWAVAQLATGLTLTTIATNLFSAALRLIPFVTVITGLVMLADQYGKTKTAIENTLPTLGAFETETLSIANSASRFSPYLNVLKQITGAFLVATGAAETFSRAAGNANRAGQRDKDRRNALREQNRASGLIGASTPSLPDFSSLLAGIGSGGGGGMSSRAAAAKAAAEAAAAAEQAILDKRKSAFESFNESVKNLFSQIKDSIMSSFSLPNLGNSVNAITRNMAKLLEKTKSFASNIAKLSGLGLNSTLLQQVIQAGPMAGSQLASAIVGGGSGFINQLNEAFNEFGNLAGGIAGIGTERAFANQGTVNNYSIEVTGGVATSADVGRAVVNAIKDFERQSGTAWRG